MSAIEVSWPALSLSALLAVPPLLLFWFYRTGLTGSFAIAVGRMTLQLLFVGMYLGWLFDQDYAPYNVGWLLVMLLVAAAAVVRRSDLSLVRYAAVVFLALLLGAGGTLIILLGAIIRPENTFEARYLIPLAGMVLGNSLQTSILALRGLYGPLKQQRANYLFALGCGASRAEALRPFWRSAIRNAFQPMIASLSTIGLVALPGMMTGQILGGSSPMTAVRYQILIMLAIACAATLSVLSCLLLSRPLALDRADLPEQ